MDYPPAAIVLSDDTKVRKIKGVLKVRRQDMSMAQIGHWSGCFTGSALSVHRARRRTDSGLLNQPWFVTSGHLGR